jgi:hypothetical protein
MNANFMVVKFSDNDFCGAVMAALRLLLDDPGLENLREKVIKAQELGFLRNSVLSSTVAMIHARRAGFDIRMGEYTLRHPRTPERENFNYRAYLEPVFKVELFQNATDFNQEWQNSEWVWMNLCNGEIGSL